MTVWILHDNGTQEWGQARVDPVAEDWETHFIEIVVGDQVPEGMPQGAVLYGNAERR